MNPVKRTARNRTPKLEELVGLGFFSGNSADTIIPARSDKENPRVDSGYSWG